MMHGIAEDRAIGRQACAVQSSSGGGGDSGTGYCWGHRELTVWWRLGKQASNDGEALETAFTCMRMCV